MGAPFRFPIHSFSFSFSFSFIQRQSQTESSDECRIRSYFDSAILIMSLAESISNFSLNKSHQKIPRRSWSITRDQSITDQNSVVLCSISTFPSYLEKERRKEAINKAVCDAMLTRTARRIPSFPSFDAAEPRGHISPYTFQEAMSQDL